MKFLIIFLFFRLAHAASLDLQEIAKSKEWLHLLYYKHSLFSGGKSQVDGKDFFFSPDGAKDPLAELNATVAAFERGGGEYGKLKQTVACAFPARKRFLEEKLGKKFPAAVCDKWKDFLQRLDPETLVLVYATAYANNPASMYGHSFIKVKSKKNKSNFGQIDLLDWSLNYAAMVPPDENGFAFAWFGVTGGYPGQFSTIPYYAKIEEYGYLESRDIWEYELNFSQEEILRFLEFVWEIETNTYFDYLFFDENCSYQLLSLLENAKPEWNLSKYFLHMIPGEAVKKLAKTPGAVRSVNLRASLTRRLNASANAFSGRQMSEWKKIYKGAPLENISTPVLDTYLLYLQAEKQKSKQDWTDEPRLKEALIARSKSKEPSHKINFGGEKTRPDIGHGAYHVSAGPVLGNINSAELAIHLAYHDLLDADPGFTPNTEILFPGIRFRYYSDSKFKLEELNLFSIVSLNPWSLIRKPIAWKAKGYFQRLRDVNCDRCMGWSLSGGAGSAWSTNSESWTLWAMAVAKAEVSGALQKNWRFLYGPELGTIWKWPSETKFMFLARPQWGAEKLFWQFEAGISQPLSQNFSLRWESDWIFLPHNTKYDSKFLAVHYF